MTWQSGGGGGIPGVTSDNQTPGGEVVAGALQAGDPNAASVPSLHYFYGAAAFNDAPGNSVDTDDVLTVGQVHALGIDSDTHALQVSRTGALNGHDYTSAAFAVTDVTASSSPAARFYKSGAVQFQVDGDGIRVHGKLKVGASITHTLGAYSGNSVPIYDEAGTLLGYMPLYA